jgi:hypothetical protein
MANTAKTELRPPSGLGAEGRRLWRDIVRDAAGQGLVLDARELHWLQSAGSPGAPVAELDSAASMVCAARVARRAVGRAEIWKCG